MVQIATYMKYIHTCTWIFQLSAADKVTVGPVVVEVITSSNLSGNTTKCFYNATVKILHNNYKKRQNILKVSTLKLLTMKKKVPCWCCIIIQ